MSRIIVADPVCAQFLGHNYPALKIFSEYFEAMDGVTEVIPVASRSLPLRDDGVRRSFTYQYEAFMRLSHAPGERFEGPGETGQTPAALTEIRDAGERSSAEDWRRLFEDLRIGPDDVIALPGADYYAVCGLADFLTRMVPPDECPRLRFRLIGVLENASTATSAPRAEVFRRLKELSERYPAAVSAETPRYATRIALAIDTPVIVTPYPVFGEQLPLPQDGPLRVAAPGSPRGDKGFLQLANIFHQVWRMQPDADVVFEAQMPPPTWKVEARELAKLYSTPGISFLDESVTDAEMVELWRRTHVAVLPYEPAVYQYRGSAVLMEALAYGRQVVTGPGTAFEAQVHYYDCGHVAHSVEQYASIICRLAETPRRDLERQAHQSRAAFLRDSRNAYREWIGA